MTYNLPHLGGREVVIGCTVSLHIEKTLFPEFSKSPLDEERLRADFDVQQQQHAKTVL